MTNNQTVSWTEPSDFSSISDIADGINHAVPSHKELQTSMTRLTNNGLVIKKGNKYSLTSKGKLDFEDASKETATLLKIWKNLEDKIKKYGT
jgi:predicted transcriptional regulator